MNEQALISRLAIVQAARKHLGTKFRHQGRKPGVGLDCVGLLVCVARELGIPYTDERCYSRMPNGVTLMDRLLESCDRYAEPGDAKVGSVLVFEFLGPEWPQHVGIRTDRGFIHTYGRIGKVCEHGYDAEWQARTVAALDFKGVGD
jgi:cell wall-associated NlpC family hydrolase